LARATDEQQERVIMSRVLDTALIVGDLRQDVGAQVVPWAGEQQHGQRDDQGFRLAKS
jgi:hypothetical protein